MRKYVCNKCENEMKLSEQYTGSLCKKCHAEYQSEYRNKNKKERTEYSREWMRTRRWLDGGPDNFLLGEDINVGIRSYYGKLKIKVLEGHHDTN